MKLTELFNSFQGEGQYVGYPMTFIRVAGCPVACPFCDTDYNRGESREIENIVSLIDYEHVCVTGGEPLAHPQIEELFEAILRLPKYHMIHIETSGCYPLPDIVWNFRKLFWITVSPKGSFLGGKKEFRPGVLEDADEVKWIVPSTPIGIIANHLHLCPINYIQPVNSTLSIDEESLEQAKMVAEEFNLPLSFQIHKVFDWR